jgi:hypothetical protein
MPEIDLSVLEKIVKIPLSNKKTTLVPKACGNMILELAQAYTEGKITAQQLNSTTSGQKRKANLTLTDKQKEKKRNAEINRKNADPAKFAWIKKSKEARNEWDSFGAFKKQYVEKRRERKCNENQVLVYKNGTKECSDTGNTQIGEDGHLMDRLANVSAAVFKQRRKLRDKLIKELSEDQSKKRLECIKNKNIYDLKNNKCIIKEKKKRKAAKPKKAAQPENPEDTVNCRYFENNKGFVILDETDDPHDNTRQKCAELKQRWLTTVRPCKYDKYGNNVVVKEKRENITNKDCEDRYRIHKKQKESNKIPRKTQVVSEKEKKRRSANVSKAAAKALVCSTCS